MQIDNFPVRHFPGLEKFQRSDRGRKLRVCIATEEIVGPVRNGGIASTYYHLARMLVELGHEVTVLYLKGEWTSDNSVHQWVDWYREMGIEFIPMPFETIRLDGFSAFWQQRYYAFYRWLSEQPPFDVVHTSEWRGGALYVLAAKRLGLNFQDTLFIVKASSPHIWNRHYQMLTIENDSMLAASFAEQKCIEWADIVVGGSAHLLSFMEHMGYSLPEGRVYMQPNVIDFQDLGIVEKRPDYSFGDIVKTDEIVFFGRLEARKGLEIFCDALDKVNAQGPRPSTVYFMGKQGQCLPGYADIANIDYINMRAKTWSFDIEVLDQFDQKEAIGFLCEKPRVAIMPSLIENSTMAVYEALAYKVPFLATGVGGTPELIDPEYHDATLTRPIPEDLARHLTRLLQEGGVVARPAFKLSDNLEIWKQFHQYLSHKIVERSVPQIVAGMTYDADSMDDVARKNREFWPTVKASESEYIQVAVSLILYHFNDVESLEITLASLRDQTVCFDEIIVAIDIRMAPDEDTQYQQLFNEFADLNLSTLDLEHSCIASCYNQALERVSNPVVAFAYSGLHQFSTDAVSVIKQSFYDPQIEIAVSVFDQLKAGVGGTGETSLERVRVLPMGGDLAAHILNDGAIGGDFFVARKSLINRLGGFYSSYHVSRVVEAFLGKAICQGCELWVVPKVLFERRQHRLKLRYNDDSGKYLRLKGVIDNATLGMKRFLLSIGEHVQPGKSLNFNPVVGGDDKASLEAVGKSRKLPLYLSRMGVALDTRESKCLVFMRQLDIGPGGLISVELNGKHFVNLKTEAVGSDHVCASWPVDVSNLVAGKNRLEFKASLGSGECSRYLFLIVGSDGNVYVTSNNGVSRGKQTAETAHKVAPLFPFHLSRPARLLRKLLRKN